MNQAFYNPSLLSMAKIRNTGANAESTLNQNRRLILGIIHDRSIVSRKELVKLTRLKPATITIAINDFLEMGIVEKTGFIAGDSGRKVMGFRLASDKYCTIAIRLNVSYLAIGVYDINHQNMHIEKVFMDTLNDIEKTCNIISEKILEIKSIIGDLKVLGVGVAVEGPFVIKDGVYQLPQPDREDGYFDLGKNLNERTGYPIIINRENNFSVYCLWKEEFRKHELGIIVMIMISYEVECGIMINGEIINGKNGTAGLLGKLLIERDENGNTTSFADRVSTHSLLKRTKELMGNYPDSILNSKKDDLNIRDVIKGFFLKDKLATQIYTEAGLEIGRMAANLTYILNPDLILIIDEIPLNKEMEEIIVHEAKRHIPAELLPKINLVLNRAKRQTQIDTSLLGQSHYIVDAFIETSDLIIKK